MRTSSSDRRHLFYGLALVSVVAAVGMVFALQGWKSKFLTFDLLPHIQGARQFLALGHIPDRGCLSRFASHIPPGTTWLLIPGLLAFDDPRLYETIGTGILYVGTLIGVFFLARRYLGLAGAVASTALYALSPLGLHFAITLWPRGHPFFYVWMIYWTDRWVREKRATYLGAALVTWAAGMYVFMELAPALFVLPAVWLLYRPPVRLRPLLISGVVILALWYPYLHFEAQRRFIDLRSQVERRYILPANYKDAWCDSQATLEAWAGQASRPFVTFGATRHEPAADEAVSGSARRLLVSASGVAGLLLANFQRTTSVPGIPLILALVVATSMVLLCASESFLNGLRHLARSWSKLIGWGLIVCGVVGNEFFLARWLAQDRSLSASTLLAVRILQAILLGTGLAVLFRRYAWLRVVFDRAAAYARTVEPGVTPRLLVVSLVIPWVMLLLMVDPSWAPRLFWLWPLQVIFLTAAVTYLPIKLGMARPWMWVSQLLMALVILGNPVLLSRLNAWLESGYAGSTPEQIQAVDYIGSRLRASGRSTAAVGYQIRTSAYMPTFHILDPQYKVGAEFDLYLERRHGVTNTNRCAEGASPGDEYRIVETSSGDLEGFRVRSTVNRDGSFHPLAQFGPYQVFKRD